MKKTIKEYNEKDEKYNILASLINIHSNKNKK